MPAAPTAPAAPAAPVAAAGSADRDDPDGLVDSAAPVPPTEQPRNPLHGVTLEAIVTALVARYGWTGLGDRIPVRCFRHDPNLRSSLAFLRRTPWAREKVEGLYRFMLRERRRGG